MVAESSGVRSPRSGDGAREYIELALEAPQTLAPLPRICVEIADLTADATTDASQFARLMQTDPVLVGQVMRVANSPALRPRASIVSVQQAVSWLGIAEIRNIAMAIMLRGEVFVAPGHEALAEEMWRESWLGSLWAKELARLRRKHVEGAFLGALMHRTGAALAIKMLSKWEVANRTTMDARAFTDLIAEFEPRLGKILMDGWRIPPNVQVAASQWRNYRSSVEIDLAATVHAAHLLATHTLHPQLLAEELVMESAVFEHLGVFLDERRDLLEKLSNIRAQV